MTLKITNGNQVFEFDGDLTADVLKLANEFLRAALNIDQAAIDALTARAKASTDKLDSAVDAATPS